MRKSVLLGLLFLCVMSPARTTCAGTFNVATVAEFQIALTAASINIQDDVINVAAGTYAVTSPLAYPMAGTETNKLLVITGAGADVTFIEGTDSNMLMSILAEGDVSISGITFRNNAVAGPLTAGLHVFSTDNITIDASLFSDLLLTGNNGGGAFLEGAGVTISNSTFLRCGVGGSSGGGARIVADTLTVSNSTFEGNGLGSASAGGGLSAEVSTSATFTDNVFRNNTVYSGGAGGGLNLHSPPFGSGTLTMTGNTFEGNGAADSCGPLAVGAGATMSIGMDVILTGNVFRGNVVPCAGFGGALNLSVMKFNGVHTVSGNVFDRNSSGTGTTSGVVTVSLPGISTMSLTGNTFSGNDSTEAAVGAIDFQSAWDLNIYNNIFRGANSSLDKLVVRSAQTVNLYNNDIDMAAASITAATLNEGGNTFFDPLFADEAAGDLHLRDGSPAVDGGLNGVPGLTASDMDGQERILDGTVDIGADEFDAPAVYFPATGVVILPEVRLQGTTKAYAVRLNRISQPGYVFALGGAKRATVTTTPSALFSKTGVLEIYVLTIKGLKKTYSVRMQRRPGTYIFDLTKATAN